jgi:GNAT superfamily N-acetyltransferase
MEEIIQDFSTKTLIKANEANLYGLTPFYYDWPGARRYSGPDVLWCVTDIPFPWCNTAFAAHLDVEQVDAAIKSFVAEGDRKGVPLFWFIGHDTTPKNIGDYLVSYGFAEWGGSTVMAIDLHAVNADMATPPNLSIRRVTDLDVLATWCRITAKGFGMPSHAEIALSKWFTIATRLKQPLYVYLALLDGEPVATSLLFPGGGVAGTYFVATIPEARHQGIGFAVTLKSLTEARLMGYRVGILQASKMGAGLYRKMGFSECCKMISYIRLEESPAPSR